VNGPTNKADIWSLGITLIKLATGIIPWNDLNYSRFMRKRAFSSESPQLEGEFSDQFENFVSKCLIVDPAKRWSASQLLNHEFVQGNLEIGFFNQALINQLPVVFILVDLVLLTDGYFKIKDANENPLQKKMKIRSIQIIRFFQIGQQLPFEIQSRLSHLMYNQKKIYVSSADFNRVLKAAIHP